MTAQPAAWRIGVGDVLVITGTSVTSKLIEIGEVAAGLPAASHVAGMHHWDAHGTPWGLEGRPGGVGWVDLRGYLRDSRTVTNYAQPKTPDQRKQLAALSQVLFGTDYDWAGGILADAWRDLGGKDMFTPDPATGAVPMHVVCSSFWAWVYAHLRLPGPRPGDWRTTEPGDWTAFIERAGWR